MRPFTFTIPCVTLVLVVSTLLSPAFAQSDEALSFNLGETQLIPAVRIDYLQNNNAFLESTNLTSTNEITVSPEFTWLADRRLVLLEGSYEGEYNTSSIDALSYADHLIALKADAELSSRKRVGGEISVDFGHEALGVNLTQGLFSNSDEEVTYADVQADGSFLYGASTAKGNVSGGLLIQDFNYTSRDDVTTGRSFRKIEPYGEFSLRVSGDTRLLGQIRLGALRYEDDIRDRNDLSLLTGIQFNATGKSGGTVRFGIVQTQRTWSEAEDQTEFIARGLVFWEPASFSRFVLDGKRELDNRGSSIVGANDLSSIEDFIRLRWYHTWSSRVSHIASVQSSNFTRACPDLDSNTLSGTFEFNVQVTRWLSVGFNADSSNRQIPGCLDVDPDLDYQRTRIGAHLRATL